MSEDWETRVQELEGKGLTRSDAQAVVDAEDALKQVDLIPALEASIALIEKHEAENAQKTLFDVQPEEQPSETPNAYEPRQERRRERLQDAAGRARQSAEGHRKTADRIGWGSAELNRHRWY